VFPSPMGNMFTSFEFFLSKIFHRFLEMIDNLLLRAGLHYGPRSRTKVLYER
jgi:hypothetical protein